MKHHRPFPRGCYHIAYAQRMMMMIVIACGIVECIFLRTSLRLIDFLFVTLHSQPKFLKNSTIAHLSVTTTFTCAIGSLRLTPLKSLA